MEEVSCTCRVDGLQSRHEVQAFTDRRWIELHEGKAGPPFSVGWPFSDGPDYAPGFENVITESPK